MVVKLACFYGMSAHIIDTNTNGYTNADIRDDVYCSVIMT